MDNKESCDICTLPYAPFRRVRVSFDCCENFCCRPCIKKYINTSKSVNCLFCKTLWTWDFCRYYRLMTKKHYQSFDVISNELVDDLHSELTYGFDQMLKFPGFSLVEIPEMFLKFCILTHYLHSSKQETHFEELIKIFIDLINDLRKENPYFITEEIRQEDFEDVNIPFKDVILKSYQETSDNLETLYDHDFYTHHRHVRVSKDNPGITSFIRIFYELFNICYPKLQKMPFIFNEYFKIFETSTIICRFDSIDVFHYCITFEKSFPGITEFYGEGNTRWYIICLFRTNLRHYHQLIIYNIILLFMDPEYKMFYLELDREILNLFRLAPHGFSKEVKQEIIEKKIDNNNYFVCPSCNDEDLVRQKGYDSYCKKCHKYFRYCCGKEIKPSMKPHKCNDRSFLSILFKLCPNCSSRINRTEGCNDMFCTQCYTKFNYATGKIHKGGFFHNDHYTQYLENLRNTIDINSLKSHEVDYFHMTLDENLTDPEEVTLNDFAHNVTISNQLILSERRKIREIEKWFLSEQRKNPEFKIVHNPTSELFVPLENTNSKLDSIYYTMISINYQVSHEDPISFLAELSRNERSMRSIYAVTNERSEVYLLDMKTKIAEIRKLLRKKFDTPFPVARLNITDTVRIRLLINAIIIEFHQEIQKLNLRLAVHLSLSVLPNILCIDYDHSSKSLEENKNFLIKLYDDRKNIMKNLSKIYFSQLLELLSRSRNKYKDLVLKFIQEKEFQILQETDLAKYIFRFYNQVRKF